MSSIGKERSSRSLLFRGWGSRRPLRPPSSPQEQSLGTSSFALPPSSDSPPLRRLLLLLLFLLRESGGGGVHPRRGSHESGVAAGGRPRLRADRVTRAPALWGRRGGLFIGRTAGAASSARSRSSRDGEGCPKKISSEPSLSLGRGKPRLAPAANSFDYDLRSDETTR